jgi:hypothetical protein
MIDSQLWYFLCFNLRQESLHLGIMLIFEIEPNLYSNFRHGAKMMIIIINLFSIYIITIKMINYQEITLYIQSNNFIKFVILHLHSNQNLFIQNEKVRITLTFISRAESSSKESD